MSQRLRYLTAICTLALVATSPAWAAPADDATEEAAPQVGQGTPRKTLAERIPSVTHRAFVKAKRVELFPALGLSLSDPFFRYVMPTVGLHYNFTESLFVGASADYYLGISTPIPVVYRSVSAPQPKYNKPVYAARLELGWAPLYGKISWLAESVLHFDTYLSGGVGIVGTQLTGSAMAGTVAIGQHYFFNEWMAIRAELRDEIFNLARTPSVSTDRKLQNLLSASIGLCFYLPEEA
jgi:outer membrane beta-barrel protein